jgi:type IV secretory pathway component VirB8
MLMDNNEQTSDDYIEISNKVRSGEYFRDARSMYDTDVHNPMSERYVYIFITLVSWSILAVSFVAWQGFFPLEPRVDFIFAANDIVDDRPRVKPLVRFHGEDPNVALRRFLVQHYVKLREEYDAKFFDRNHNAVESLSIPKVLEEYEEIVSPLNPSSPVSKYQRSISREINILSTTTLAKSEYTKNIEYSDYKDDPHLYYMQIIYDAVLTKGENKSESTRYKVDVAFRYNDIKLDEVTGKIRPYGFVIISYNAKNL